MKTTITALLTASVAGMAIGLTPVQAATSCEALAALALPKATVTSAQIVAAGAFSQPAGRGAGAAASLPAFCRVAATLTPSADSDIKIEVWLPASGWNGKFQGVGNGGWTGAIAYAALARALATWLRDRVHRHGPRGR